MSNLAQQVIDAATFKGMKIATAESCTGGMIAAALTDVAGSSSAFDRGFVTYSNQAKADMLGVPLAHTDGPPGAVSELVAREMVEGALAKSGTEIAVAVTGIAGPGGGSADKPVGLVYVACGLLNGEITVKECRFAQSHNATSREAIRLATVETALALLLETLGA